MNDVIVFALVIGSVTGCLVVLMVARALTHRLLGRGDERLDPRELEDVRSHLASLQSQLDELTERQDFAERVLAQAKERGILGAPKAGA